MHNRVRLKPVGNFLEMPSFRFVFCFVSQTVAARGHCDIETPLPYICNSLGFFSSWSI